MLGHIILRMVQVSLATAATLPVVHADIITVAPSRPVMCVKDTVNVSWTIDEWYGGTEFGWLEVRDSLQDQAVGRFDLFRYGLTGVNGPSSLEAVEGEGFQAVIYCRRDGPFRTPTVHTVKWDSTADGQSLLILAFSEPTNRPTLQSGVALNDAILINHGEIQLRAGRGIWNLEGETLTISHIDRHSWTDIMESISNGTFHAMTRTKLLHDKSHNFKKDTEERISNLDSPDGQLQGDLTIRMSSAGKFTFHLYLGNMLSASSTDPIDVELCPNEVEVMVGPPNVSAIAPSKGNAAAPQRPFFAVEGVLAISGYKGIKVPHGSFPVSRGTVVGGISSDSWSLSLWLYLLDDSDARYRGLFHKGDGGDMGRTPSVLLSPHSNRISLRVTSTTDHDIGADSVATLGVRTWNHLAFVFENNTYNEISATIFVNGVADVVAAFRDIDVVGNDGSLFIGGNPDNPGPRSFISMVRLWEGCLPPDHIHADYQASRLIFYGEGRHSTKSRFFAVHAVSTYARLLVTPSAGGGSSDEAEETLVSLAPKQVRDAAFETAVSASSLCKTFSERLEAFKIAAEAGHTESRVRYASLLLTGREQYDGVGASCGREKDLHARAIAEAKWNGGGAEVAVEELELAAREGSPRASFLLAILILSGLDGGTARDTSYEGCATCRVHRISPTKHLMGIKVGTAVLDHWWGAVDNSRPEKIHGDEMQTWAGTATAMAIGLLHFAAAGGHPEAHLALGLRYLRGNGLQLDTEAAAWYLGYAAKAAYAEYHVVGKQPIIEEQRLTESNEATVATGQLGEDDSVIQYQIHRAGQGHVPSQVALGDLYYWGARGLPRDQVRALEYFNVAANAGDNTARCAAASMYLRGEGAEVNHTRAVQLYEIAAEENHMRALNGLGFEYFNGHAVPRNVTRAYEYFQRAADMKQDGDSLFNAGHCLASGIGTEQDFRRAADLFRLGADLGHVDCAYEIGVMSNQGRGIERSAADAAANLLVVAQVGPWAKRLRSGFNCYLQGDVLCALALYAEVEQQTAELGYEIAASNAAFLLDRRKVHVAGFTRYSSYLEDCWLSAGGLSVVNAIGLAFDKQREGDESIAHDRIERTAWMETMSIRFHIMAATQGYFPSFIAIGDAFFYGRSGFSRNPWGASWWYSRASASGMIRGSYNMGYMHEHGLGVRRDFALASSYYERSRKNALTKDGLDQHLSGMPIEVLISLAKLRLFFNRLSGGRLISLWERSGMHEGQNTKDWLPDWFLLAVIVNTTQAVNNWVASTCSSPAVLTRLDDGVQNCGPSLRTTSAFEYYAVDEILLVVLIVLLTIVLILRRRSRSTL